MKHGVASGKIKREELAINLLGSMFLRLGFLIGMGWLAVAFLPGESQSAAASSPARTCLLTWNEVLPSVEGVLTGLAANSENDVWAVGSRSVGALGIKFRSLSMHWDGADPKYIRHFDGTDWNGILDNSAGFAGVLALSPDLVWGVGSTIARAEPPCVEPTPTPKPAQSAAPISTIYD